MVWSEFQNLQFLSLKFDFKIWFQARLVTGTFEKRASERIFFVSEQSHLPSFQLALSSPQLHLSQNHPAKKVRQITAHTPW